MSELFSFIVYGCLIFFVFIMVIGFVEDYIDYRSFKKFSEEHPDLFERDEE